jgi:hypothetical protein
MSQLLPQLSECVDVLKQNVKTWETYEETKEDKEVYEVGKKFQLHEKLQFKITEQSMEESMKSSEIASKRPSLSSKF